MSLEKAFVAQLGYNDRVVTSSEGSVDIGAFIKAERKRRGLTQKQLADLSGVGLNFVYQLEKNKPTVQLACTNQVLGALGYRVGIIRDFRPWEESKH